VLFHCRYYSDKTALATAPAAPTAPQTVKKLDNLFFIEEPKGVHVIESKFMLFVEQCRYVIFFRLELNVHNMEITLNGNVH